MTLSDLHAVVTRQHVDITTGLARLADRNREQNIELRQIVLEKIRKQNCPEIVRAIGADDDTAGA